MHKSVSLTYEPSSKPLVSASERRGNTFKRFEDFHLKAYARNWPNQGHKLALTVLLVPNPLDSGLRSPRLRSERFSAENIFQKYEVDDLFQNCQFSPF